MQASLPRRCGAEFLGTLLLLVAVIGSGIMGERLSQGQQAIALLANTLATGFALFVLIEALRPVSGAHFNPCVTLVFGRQAGLSPKDQCAYIGAQVAGAVMGAALANLMFDLPIIELSSKMRGGAGQVLGEVIATAGLVFIVARAAPARVALVVAAYIGSAYWFTSSTSFANPAAVAGRMLTDTFAGIAPGSAPGFLLAQGIGSLLGAGLAMAIRDKAKA